ncbi:MAG: DUF4326 domain-containing protein [Pseudonocardia sp.]
MTSTPSPEPTGRPRIMTRARAVELYARHLHDEPELRSLARQELAGADLACWCPPGDPCHADVLIEVANS